MLQSSSGGRLTKGINVENVSAGIKFGEATGVAGGGKSSRAAEAWPLLVEFQGTELLATKIATIRLSRILFIFNLPFSTASSCGLGNPVDGREDPGCLQDSRNR